MSLKTFLKEIGEKARVGETALYTPLSVELFRGCLRYPSKNCSINEAGDKGIPDIRLVSGGDGSQWVTCEVKLHDAEIRGKGKRKKIWEKQIVGKEYITPETVYVMLCGPRTFYVCDLDGELVAGVEMDANDKKLANVLSGEKLDATEENFRRLLEKVSYEESLRRPQYEEFRNGTFRSGRVRLTEETLPMLQDTFLFAVRNLKAYCAEAFERLKREHADCEAEIAELQKQLDIVGSQPVLRRQIIGKQLDARAVHRVAMELFDVDYPRFVRDQAYSGTETDRDFEDIFATNTAHVALSRLFFVRICEDVGLTTRKISNGGIKVWRDFVANIKDRYQDLIDVAFRDVVHIYSKLFEATVFDWFGSTNDELSEILERILFRMNAFSFQGIGREVLGEMYQYFRPRAERKRLGEYYTADEVVDYIIARVGIGADPEIMTKDILDPACGSFTFGVRSLGRLLAGAERLSPENKLDLVRQRLTGYDINPFSAFLSHLSLLFALLDVYLEAKNRNPKLRLTGFNIENVNSLASVVPEAEEMVSAAKRAKPKAFDYVIGNPPFVRNERIPPGDRETLEKCFAHLKCGNTDLSTYFLHCGIRHWLKDGGAMGMVSPIGLANAKASAGVRAALAENTITEVVSLEWMAKEVFAAADIIPMLIFVKKEKPRPSHKVTVVSGMQKKADLAAAVKSPSVFKTYASQIAYRDWLDLSPTGDWALEVKAEDVPILQKLKALPPLQSIADTTYAVTLGGKTDIVREFGTRPPGENELPFCKGQHVCAFGLSDADELIDLSRIKEARSASIWGDLSFYRKNHGRVCEGGADYSNFDRTSLLKEDMPSDTKCCLVARISKTLTATVMDPLETCANDSCLIVRPLKYSAYVTAAIINSRISRYYSFLLLRAAILLRKRSTWYPRTVDNLPCPDLTAKEARRLHELAEEAASLSAKTDLNEVDVYLREMASCSDTAKAGFLGVHVEGSGDSIDKEDISLSDVRGQRAAFGPISIVAKQADYLLLAIMAMLADDGDEFPVAAVEDLPVPRDHQKAAAIARSIRSFSSDFRNTRDRMDQIVEEIDKVVAARIGLSAREHQIMKKRCREFPLSATVNSPRYVWSPDRKRQARRAYDSGERFRT